MKEEKITELIGKCAKCGACRSVCPLLEIDRMETSVARGKIEIIRRDLQEELPATDADIRSFLDNCLLCGRCEIRCPNQVKTVEIFCSAKANNIGYGNMIFDKKALVKTLSLPSSAIKAGFFVGKGLAALLAEKIPTDSGLFYRFPGLLSKGERMVPEIPARSFLESAGETIDDLIETEATFLFTGCVYNYIYPPVLESARKTFMKDGREGKMGAPVEQSCCGLPALGAGDLRSARSAGEKNIELFQRLKGGKILFPCGSCLYMFKKIYPDLFSGTVLHDQALEIAGRCRDYESHMLELARNRLKPSPGIEGRAVSYHRPCHLASIPGAVERAETLLRRVLGDNFKPMKGAERCCGFGGTFNLVHYEKSRDMGVSKIKLAEESETDIVATSCSGCIHQLKESSARTKSRIQVVHVAELFDI